MYESAVQWHRWVQKLKNRDGAQDWTGNVLEMDLFRGEVIAPI